MAKQTKRSVTTEIVLGQAAQNISKAVAELNSATEQVNNLNDILPSAKDRWVSRLGMVPS